MEITKIELANQNPTFITAHMTAEEKKMIINLSGKAPTVTMGGLNYLSVADAATVTKTLEKMSPHQMAEIQPDGANIGCEIYNCLAGELFNRYYDDGVDDYLRN